MTDMLSFMAAPFGACLVLVGLHAYFGIHVIERRILFVDLAVAQFAALGAVVGFAFGQHPGELGSTLFSLGFAILAAALFALTRVRIEKLPQEAIIGITFVVASAATILVADRAPEGAEHIKETLAGSLLWVTWPTVLKVLVIYVVVGLFLWLLRRRFMLITTDAEEAYRRGWQVRWWDWSSRPVWPSCSTRECGRAWSSAGSWESLAQASASWAPTTSICRRDRRSWSFSVCFWSPPGLSKESGRSLYESRCLKVGSTFSKITKSTNGMKKITAAARMPSLANISGT
jgi:hypothetical protein